MLKIFFTLFFVLYINTFGNSFENINKFQYIKDSTFEELHNIVIKNFKKFNYNTKNIIKQSFNKKLNIFNITFKFDTSITKQLIAMDRIERNLCLQPKSKLFLSKGFIYKISEVNFNNELIYLKLINYKYCKIHFR